MDDAAVDRVAEAAWDLRCHLSAVAKQRPAVGAPWADRAPFLQDIDRAVVRLVAAEATAGERERITSELKEHMAGFFAHYGGSVFPSLSIARDLAEGITQILAREPLGGTEQERGEEGADRG